jgi:hypothetical protein
MTILYEVRPEVMRKSDVHMVPANQIHKYTGFQSVYGYPEEVVRQVRRPAMEFKEMLDMQGYSYEMYDSGNRSQHFHVPIEPMFGPLVPLMQRFWMQEHVPLADMSIYKTSGVFRIKGTQHQKTGKYKVLLHVNKGPKTLKIEVEIPDEEPETTRHNSTDKDLGSVLFAMVNRKVSKGTLGRANYVYRMARLANDAGVGMQEAMDMIERWNWTLCSPPLELHVLHSNIKGGYR